MNTDKTTFGDRVKMARKKMNLTQETLAKKIGVSQGTITHIENGRNQESRYTVELARALNVSAEWLSHGRGGMASDSWFFSSISVQDFIDLPDSIKEDIEDYINLKIQKNKLKRF